MGSSTVICSGTEQEILFTSFAELKKILLVNSVIYFIVNKLMIDHFSEHFHAYNVFESDEKDVMKADCIQMYKPFDL